MQIRFLGQGFEQESKDAVGKHLTENLAAKDFHTFTAFSAFTSVNAIGGLRKYILEAPDNFKAFNFFLGINHRGTSKEALEAVLDLDVNSFIFYYDQNIIFHPKMYLFEGEKFSRIIVGSSNLTGNGLFANIESSVLIEIKQGNKKDVEFLNQIKRYYKGVFDRDDPNLKPITKELIKSLVDEGLVPTENERRSEFSISNRQSRKKAGSDTFPSRKTPKIPPEFRRQSTSFIAPKVSLKEYNSKSYPGTEQSYHFPQGVHIGHILYILKTIRDRATSGSYLDAKYIKLTGKLDADDLGRFQRKTKYKLVALMEMGIIEDIRKSPAPSKFALKLTKHGKELTKMLTPIIDVANLDFKKKPGKIPSWEMLAGKTHYVSLVKALVHSEAENLLFWNNKVISFPAVGIMIELLKSASKVKIGKKDFIYKKYFSFRNTLAFCKSLEIKPGTAGSAEHRCPFLLDLLEIGGIIEQERSFVTLVNMDE